MNDQRYHIYKRVKYKNSIDTEVTLIVILLYRVSREELTTLDQDRVTASERRKRV